MKAYNWKLTAKKFFWTAAEVVVIGLLAYAVEAPAILVFVPILEAVRNYIKHK